MPDFIKGVFQVKGKKVLMCFAGFRWIHCVFGKAHSGTGIISV